MLHQKVLFSKEESLAIRNCVYNLEDRVIGTYHPEINDGNHDPNGGHNLAQHLPWSDSKDYEWISQRILTWLSELELPIENLGWEFIIQKYLPGFEFKPHIDDVLGPDKKSLIRARYYTILIQLASEDEYDGGELWVHENNKDIKINQTLGNVCIFGQSQLHWVTKITDGERWSCTIFLEKDALKKVIV